VSTVARRVTALLVAAVAFAVPLLFPPQGLSTAGARMLAIFALAIVLWVSEAVPLAATAVLIILLQVLLISNQALGGAPPDALPASAFYATLADPVIILLLGGFMLAMAAQRYGVDRALAAWALGPVGGHPRRSLLVLMVLTAALSMFVSNTATAATMFAVLLPVLRTAPTGRTRAGLALAVPVAANIGGLATPVGSPPNAIAVAALAREGYEVTFLQWMAFGVPLAVVLLLLSWLLLARLFVSDDEHLAFDLNPGFDRSRRAVAFYVIAAITVLGWLTESLHGLPSATVGFFAVVALLLTTALSTNDLGALPWAVLWLVSGGIALGLGMGATGVDEWLVGRVDWGSLSELALLVGLAVVAVGLSTVMSNSATANLLVPIGIALAAAVSADPVVVACVIAVACALAMALPISNPANALAYATGEVPTRSMAVVGACVAVVGIPLLVLVVPPVLRLMGF
jgi:sodium-dependent dicarboxylate transporter 2/3/5